MHLSRGQAPFGPLLEHAHLRSYAKGQTVLYPGDYINYVFVLDDGAVKAHEYDEQGNQKVLTILSKPQTVFPLVNFDHNKPLVAWFYTALTDIRAYAVPYADFQAYLNRPEGAALCRFILRQSVGELQQLMARLDSLGKSSSTRKLVAALQYLARRHARRSASALTSWRRIKFPVSHQLLADITGLTRESVTIAMHQLRDTKMVRCPHPALLEVNRRLLDKHQ
ncbi:Crp/Fnr family transcriptional regulator [Candidatus Saccharibacteria bacterium]|nr:Crp/Fnr family transcriptional regulator [Candidatus Saccharibacteria bacterium]